MFQNTGWEKYLFAAGTLLLAIHPAVWLFNTWTDPAYDSQGYLVAALAASLFLWSLGSARTRSNTPNQSRAIKILCFSAAVRLAGQVLGVNIIGAAMLALDVYAIGLLCGLNLRTRAISPGWLAVLFAFSLPLERVLQRTIGYGLQHVSAAGACKTLELAPDPVQCEGIRILLAGQDVLVDLPCSGARGLLMLLLLFTSLAALTRPSWLSAATGITVTLLAAVGSNILRISALATGLAYPDAFGGIDVMAAPWHEAIGVITLALGAIPILTWAAFVPNRELMEDVSETAPTPRLGAVAGIMFVFAATTIVMLPASPVDVARRGLSSQTPVYISGYRSVPSELSQTEQAYFTQFGGSAAKASYGDFGLLLVRTSAPLRHLHAPDECLTGAGHRVRYMGQDRTGLPTAVYRSEDPQGNLWRVSVTFVSNRGELATSVAEAVWLWLKQPTSDWTMVQRISPWDADRADLHAWEYALMRTLNLSNPPQKKEIFL